MSLDKYIKQQKNGKYMIRFKTTIKGKSIECSKKGIPSKGEARRVAPEIKKEFEAKKNKIINNIVTWKEAVSSYLNYPHHENINQSTLHYTRDALRAHTKEWEETPISEITKESIAYQINKKHESNDIETKKKLLQYIRNVFKFQITANILKKNPAKNITFGPEFDSEGNRIRKIKKKRRIAMTRQEVLFLLDEAYKQDHPWYPVWYANYQFGFRRGEVKVIEHRHLNFDEDRVNIEQAYVFKTKKIGPPKSGKPRPVPMNAQNKLFLKELLVQRKNEKYLFPQFKDWQYSKASDTLRRFQKEIGIRQTNFHSLRASFITHLLLKGTPPTTVQELAGHADFKTTMEYVRISASDLQGATNVIGISPQEENNGNIIPFKK